MAVEWSPDLTLNDEMLDGQHVELFRRLEEAAAALAGPRETLDAAVDAVAEALLAHLAAEERLMDETRYPERIRHKSAHELFLADFERMRRELRASGPTASVAEWVKLRIPEWLRFHIRVNDEPFGEWLTRRRRAPSDAKGGSDGRRRLS